MVIRIYTLGGYKATDVYLGETDSDAVREGRPVRVDVDTGAINGTVELLPGGSVKRDGVLVGSWSEK